ncbi:MAG TPA: hypothetical protein DCG53_01520 [Syntrophus sp. (in: bacteria)]|nr:hypothetical protein [Syntrophus sp. (in: bacteria)]
MDSKFMGKQMLQYNKTSFEKSFSTMVNMQNNAEKMFQFWLHQTKGFPEEGRNFMFEWIDFYKKLRDDYKTSVDEGYRKMEEFLSGDHKEV